jgi:hypothetical protein
MRYLLAAVLIGASGMTGISVAADTTPNLPFDTPQTMRNFEAVCTGIGSNARNDPRWAAYPLKVEIAGKEGQLLGAAQVTLMKGDESLVTVGCGGPWVLFKVDPGAYQVKADVQGTTVTNRVNVSGQGQARVIMRFPDIGGATSPEYVPK